MKQLKTTSIKFREQEDEKLFVSPDVDADDDDDDDTFVGSEDDGEVQDEKSHARLLNDISKISKRMKAKARRDVRTSLGPGVAKVDTDGILKRLGNSSLNQSTQKIKSLPKPVEKTVARKAKRAAGFEKVSMEVNKWGKVVHIHRQAEQITFPLNQADLRVKTQEEAESVKPKTPLEQEVYALLHGAKLIKEKKETEEDQATKRALSLQQVKERNREMWHRREMKRRFEHKAMLQNKSKSKKYHRLMRRERLKKEKAELEQLQKTNPEAALEKLEEMERLRIEERMSLRHKASKWAHFQGLRANRDKNAMAALKENQRMHRELTTKITNDVESEEEDGIKEIEAMMKEREEAVEAGTYDPMNPWTNSLSKVSSQLVEDQEEKNESFTKFKKFWEEVNYRKLKEKEIQDQLDKREKEMGEVEVKEDDEEEEKEVIEDAEKEITEEEVEKEMTEEEAEEVTNSKEKAVVEKENDKNRKVMAKEKIDDDMGDSLDGKEAITENGKEKALDTVNSALVSIDEMFDEAEIGIQKKVKRKLEKLGINTKSDGTWEKVKRKKKSKDKSKMEPVRIEEFDFSCKNNKDNIDEKLERVKTLQDMDSIQEGSVDQIHEAADILKKGPIEQSPVTTNRSGSNKKVEVDPTKFLQVDTKKLATAMPDSISQDEEGLDDDDDDTEDAEDIIREAFADDYLVDEFSSEKAAAIERDKPKNISLALPGWGTWTGPNLKMSKTKLRKFSIRCPKGPRRKDANIGNVIYNEKADVHDNLRKAMVSDLPHPFKSVKDFEASVRAPVGRMFVPEVMHKKLTAPPLVTKIGTVIEPMTEDELLRHKNKGPAADKKQKKQKGNAAVKRNRLNRNGLAHSKVKGKKRISQQGKKNN